MAWVIKQVVGSVDTSLDAVSEELGIILTRDESRANVRTLLRTVWKKFLGDFTGFVEMIARHVPSPSENAKDRVLSLYTGKDSIEDSEVMNQDFLSTSQLQKIIVIFCWQITQGMMSCSADGPLMVHVSKQYPASSGEDGSAVGSNSFNVLGRVFSGMLHAGQHVRILGETYSSIDEEDSRVVQVGRLWIPEGRYKVEVSTDKNLTLNRKFNSVNNFFSCEGEPSTRR